MSKQFMLLLFAFYTFWIGLKIRPDDKHPKAMLWAGFLYMLSWALAIVAFVFMAIGID